MTISLTKGANISLSKQAPGLAKLLVGMGWDARCTDGSAFDLDASAFVLGEDGKVLSDRHLIFYSNLESPCASVVHSGDNTTGAGDGDDEAIRVFLSMLSIEAKKVVFTVTIHEALERKQNFGQVSGAFIRIVNEDGGAELTRYDLSEDYSTETAMILGELYRNAEEWKFRAIGSGFTEGLAGLCRSMGLAAA